MERVTQYSRAGLTFDVVDSGPLDGPVVLLLHGFPADHSTWDEVIPRLTAEGFRTLAPDQRGYSPRARPRGRAAYRPRELVRDAVALLDAAGARTATVVGHDWGGILAWWIAAAAPRRVEELVVLSTPHPSALRRSLFSSNQALKSWYMALFQLPLLPERLIRPRIFGLLRGTGVPRPHAERYTRRMSEPGALTAALNWYRALLLPGGGSPGGDGRIHVPTRYLWGRKDMALGARAAALTADYVAAPYVFVEVDEGHWLPERAPELVAREIITAISPQR